MQWLVIAAWIVAPLVAAATIVVRSSDGVRSDPQPVWLPVREAAGVVTKPALLHMSWENQSPVVAPHWSGLVQRIFVAPGDHLASGTPVALVDGVKRIAAATDIPFSRALQSGDVGAEVEALNRLLDQLGLPSTAGDRFAAGTVQGVLELSESVLGGPGSPIFEPGWLLYLPTADGIIADVTLRVGAPAPPPGTEVVRFQPRLVDAVVGPDRIDQAGNPSVSTPLARPDGREPDDGLPAGLADLREGAYLVVGGVEIGPLSVPDGQISADGIGALASAVPPGTTSVRATVAIPLPADASQLPAGAVFSGHDGSTCSVVRDSPRSAEAVVEVEILDSYQGISIVTGLVAGQEVEVPPHRTERRRCPSS